MHRLTDAQHWLNDPDRFYLHLIIHAIKRKKADTSYRSRRRILSPAEKAAGDMSATMPVS